MGKKVYMLELEEEEKLMKKKKIYILIVDDEAGIRQTLQGILADEGHSVATAENGYEAIEKIKENPFDLIFMDVNLPQIDGVTAYKEIKKVRPEAAVIMMTAYSVEDLIKEAMREGAYAVIYKPVRIEKILALIEEVRKELASKTN